MNKHLGISLTVGSLFPTGKALEFIPRTANKIKMMCGYAHKNLKFVFKHTL